MTLWQDVDRMDAMSRSFVLFFAGMLWSMRKDAPAKEVASEEK